MDHWPLCASDESVRPCLLHALEVLIAPQHHRFRPLSRLAEGEVQATITSVDSALRGAKPVDANVPIQAKAKKADADIGRLAPILSWGQIDAFRFLWAHNIPVVIENVDSKLKARWTPDALTYSHGQDVVSMIRSSTAEARTESVTVEQFFAEFRIQSRKDVVKIKESLVILSDTRILVTIQCM